MQAITQALREREASLLTLQALEDSRDKTQRGISMADENSSDRKRWGAQTNGACCTVPVSHSRSSHTRRAQKARTLRDDLAALEAATEAAEGEYNKLTDRNQKVAGRLLLLWG